MIAVVGASGVGKDSVMDGILGAMPGLHRVCRVITRAPELGGEEFQAVTEAEFAAMAQRGAFALHWGAHGLFYGIPVGVQGRLAGGTDCLANVSRGALMAATDLFPSLVVLHLTATPETLAKRLAGRGRETDGEIAKRLARSEMSLPAGLNVIEVSNDGPLEQTITRAVALLQPARA